MYEFKVADDDLHLGSSGKLYFVLFQKSLKPFFPQSPPSLLVPLLTPPSGQYLPSGYVTLTQCTEASIVCVQVSVNCV